MSKEERKIIESRLGKMAESAHQLHEITGHQAELINALRKALSGVLQHGEPRP